MKTLLTLISLTFLTSVFAQDTDKLSLYFDFNSSSLSTIEMNKLKQFMNDADLMDITSVTAYCDTVGSTGYNERLAKKRLNSVLAVLSSRSSTMRTNINGEREAAKATNYDAAEARRVDIIYTPEPPPMIATPKTKGAEKLATSFQDFIDGDENRKTIDLTLLFIPGYPVLIKDSEPEIEELFQLLKDNPKVNAHIHGHVCCADDYKLSYDRALMVYQYLTKKGIAKERLKYHGHSNHLPKISPEVTEADRLANRRVTIDFSKE